MKKSIPLAFIFLGLYFIWSAIGVVIDDSNHMGSRINLAKESLQHDIETNLESIPEKLVVSIKNKVEIIAKEGEQGFDLLFSIAFKLFLSGIVLIFAGIGLRATMPNKAIKQD